jgi:hypothetical protein
MISQLNFYARCILDDNGVMALNNRWLAYAGVEPLIPPTSPLLHTMSNTNTGSGNVSSGSGGNVSSGNTMNGSNASLLSSLVTATTSSINAMNTNAGGANSNGSNAGMSSNNKSLVDYLPSASDAKETVIIH